MKKEKLESYEIEIRKVALLAAAGLKYTSKRLPINGPSVDVIVDRVCDAITKAAEHFDGKVIIKISAPSEEDFFIYIAGGVVLGATTGFAIAGIPGAMLGGVAGGLLGAAASVVSIKVEMSDSFLQLVTE